MNSVGCDVGASENVVVVSRNGRLGKEKRFKNTPEGHAALIKYLNAGKRKIRVCLEATGTYHFDLAVALSEADGIEVMVMNPKSVKNFARALLQRNKTDAVDAALLAEIAEMLNFRKKFQVWQAPGQAVLTLRACSRRLDELTRQKTRAKNQQHALQATASTPDMVLDSVRCTIKNLEQQIGELRKKVLSLIEQDDELSGILAQLITVNGIAEASAISILGELLVLPEGMTARQWAAHAGLDPREFTSGTSADQKPRLTKAGNRRLRNALFMPALTAIGSNTNIKAYYLHLAEGRGKLKKQAICAVMRKLLHAIYGMLKTGKSFDHTRFYTIPAAVNSAG